MGRLVSVLRLVVPLLVGLTIGIAVARVPLVSGDTGKCSALALRFFVAGVEQNVEGDDSSQVDPGSLVCDGRIYVPLQWLAGRLDREVAWDLAAGTVAISGPDMTPTGMYRPDTRTGIPAVDRVLDAITAQGEERPIDLIAMQDVPCTVEVHGMPGLPPCDEGVQDGTPTEVFLAATCHVSYVSTLEGAQGVLNNALSRSAHVYAIFHENWDLGSRVAKYAITVGSDLAAPVAPIIHVDAGGNIVGLVQCAGPSDSVPSDANFILPPMGQ